MKTRLLTATVAIACLLSTVTARAHFVWLVVTPQGGGSQAEIYFAETADPGPARLIEKIAPLVKAWSVAKDGSARPLTLEKSISGDNAMLESDAPPDSAIIAASCNYGVFGKEGTPRLLHYYAKHVGPDAPALAPAKELPLDVLSKVEGKTLTFEVLWQDKPAVDVPVVVTNPDGDEKELRTDSEGRVQVSDAIPGDYAVRATRVEKQHGEEDGKHFDEIWTISTLTLQVGDAAPVTAHALDANQLLKQARAARAVWNDFPGFNAKVVIRVDEHVHRGSVSVDPHGEVKLHGIEGGGVSWVTQQLLSMIRHRMPAPFSDSPVAYLEEADEHPLGRLVKFADESLHSTYRIDDDVITEVHRTTGDSRFTITTLDVWRNSEGHYVPQDFVASFWNAQTGELVSNEAVHDTWQRVGAFDLPLRHIVVKTSSRGRQVMQVDFSDFELLPPPKATAGR